MMNRVTSLLVRKPADELFQVSEKLDTSAKIREQDEVDQRRHYESWDTFWGRPGYGAPNSK